MLFYESERIDRRGYLFCQRDHNFNFPAHLHHSFEFLCVQSGTLACTLETESVRSSPRRSPAGAAGPDPQLPHHWRISERVMGVFYRLGARIYCSAGPAGVYHPCVPHGSCAPDGAALAGRQPLQAAGRALPDLRCSVGAVLFAAAPVPDVDAHLSSKIIDYVQKNYTHTLTLEQMARDLGYNYTYLSAYFNHSLHTGFQGFINQYRISHAAALLQGSSLPITQVAEQCGFGTIRSFNRVFPKEKGMTPSAFRKQNVL